MEKLFCCAVVQTTALMVAGPCLAAGVDAAADLGAVIVRAGRDALPVSTTAGLTPAPLFELPLSATRLQAESFTERLPKDIADLADYAAGVSRRSNYWGVETPTFQLRGFNGGESTAYYKDGFRYQARGPISMANVEAVEILRGPVSAIYGWSDPGGAVQVRVKQPTAKPNRELAVQTDSWGRSAAVLDLGGRLGATEQNFGNGPRFRFVAAREQGGSFRDRQHLEQTLLAPSVSWDFSGERELSLSLEWLDDKRTTDYGIPAVYGAPANVPISRIYTEDWGSQHTRSTRFTARWGQPALGGKLSAAWSFYRLDYLDYRDVEPYSVNGTTVNRWFESYPERYRWVTGYLDWSREFEATGGSHRFATRLEMARESRSLYGGQLDDFPAIDAYNPVYGQAWTPTADFSVYDQAWSNRSIGLALQDEFRRGDWTWLAGVRFGYIDQVFDYADHLPTVGETHTRQSDHAVTPRLGVRWQAAKAVSLYANLSAGKMPTLPQSRAFSGDSFTPISGKQAEAGVKIQPEGGNWLGSVAIFDIERRNVLTRDLDHPAFSIQTGVQRSRGLELEWQGKLAPGWRLTGQGTWLDAFIAADNRYAPGNRLPYAPRFGASAWLTHTLAAETHGRWSLSGGIVHQGERYADFANAVRLPGYTRVDAGMTYQERAWSATLALENLADLRYYASGVENRPAVIYPGAPRMVSLRVKFDFR